MVWLVLLIMIWIQTGWFWERDKKESRWIDSFHRKLYHGTCGKCPQIPERGLWQKELEEWQELGPSPQRTPLRSLSAVGSPTSRAAAFSSHSFHSSAVKSQCFLYPSPPFSGPWKRKVLVCLSPRTQPPPSWPSILVGLLGTTPVPWNEQDHQFFNTTLCQTDGHVMSLYLQTTGVGGFLTLYRYKLRFRGSHSEAGCWDVSPSQSRPEPTAMKTKTPWKHHYFQCVSATCFRANAYGALGYLHDYSVLTLWGKALLLPFYRAGN